MNAVLRAHAKINLVLRVGPRRPDGYHDLLTLFQSIALADRVRVRLRAAARSPGLRLSVSDPAIPADERNTVHRAYRFLCDRVPLARAAAFDVRIEKRIPVGAGLGGGSADAAAFLIGACRLLKVPPPLSKRDLAAIADRIGADVPFCLLGGTAVGRGRGERLTPLAPLPARRVVLLIPSVRISTREAYGALDRSRRLKNLTNPAFARSLYSVVRAIRRGQRCAKLENDFQPTACRSHPELARVAGRLSGIGDFAMSGSGSAFFVLPSTSFAFKDVRDAFPKASLIKSVFVRRGVRVL